MNKMKQFLWFCSGANMALLKKCPTESNKYMGIGGTVFFTGILAALSAGYALYTVFGLWYWGVVFGLVWGVMIFNLDRFIVSSMRKKESAWSEWKLAFPRLVLAVFLALVISKPLELKVFEREINRVVDEGKIQAMTEAKVGLEGAFPEVARLEEENQALRDEIAAKSAFRDQKQKEYDEERFGVKTPGTTGIVGLGTNAKKKEEQLDAAQVDLEAIQQRNWAKIDENEMAIQEAMGRRQFAFEEQQKSIGEYDGLAARMDALSSLTAGSNAIALANLFIILLFVAMETAPVFVKLIAGRGPYDELMDKAESEVAVYAKEMKFKNEEKSRQRLQLFKETLDVDTELAIKKAIHKSKIMTNTEMDALERSMSTRKEEEAPQETSS
ncbi:DUF4407 domain-containing protein [Echinicola sp. CAU 1574]|uniref:DUF4407 domain-containing protein n=1 Tax=Echinicola arenosa TaxID=2774144 RepID=A0ABR9AFN0_9BACT|nr:DUF4407 domain-containing protein [Echinicola arenosa]MBD8487649.1 DUF4407 domain-containing protein [Echinicola arenosa]